MPGGIIERSNAPNIAHAFAGVRDSPVRRLAGRVYRSGTIARDAEENELRWEDKEENAREERNYLTRDKGECARESHRNKSSSREERDPVPENCERMRDV